MNKLICGAYAVLLTPFAGGKPDLSAYADQIARLNRTGTKGYTVNGSTGEFVCMSLNEQMSLTDTAAERAAAGKGLVVSACTACAADTLRLARHAHSAGAKAVLVCPPYYFTHTQEQIRDYFLTVAERSPVPVLLYNIPLFTQEIAVDTVLSLIGHENIAGIKDSYLVENVQVRISAVLDQLLMKWISKEGKDMFNLQANSFDIANGIRADLDAQIEPDGLTIGNFNIMSFSYPKEIQDMINKTASHSMIGDLGRYQQVSMTDAMAQGKNAGGSTAADMAGMMMGMNLANQMMQNMQNTQNTQTPNSQSTPSGTAAGAKPNFCPNCGTKTEGANFCPNCGQKLV